ncbi:putative bifunctional diguanylate cyclase/phosphodiesterase [Massilia glaciei]|nr:EAL domain-containing protein [Massilia glaciei]
MFTTMCVFELAKQFLLPAVTIWESHALTIVFTTLGATLVARHVLRERERLIGRLTAEGRERQQALAQAGDQNSFLSALIDNLPLSVFTKDPADEFRFTRWNRHAEKEFGFSRESMLGKNDYDFFNKEEADFFRATDEQVMREKKVVDVECETVTTAHGQFLAHTIKVPFYGNEQTGDALLGILENISARKQVEQLLVDDRASLAAQVAHRTSDLAASQGLLQSEVAQRLEAERKVEYLAYYDVLTDLPNRTLVEDRIERAIDAAKRSNTHVAVLCIDLDDFKNVNDSLGHQIGDQFLQAFGARMLALMRSSDTFGRNGGDEFVRLLTGLRDEQYSAWIADKVIAAARAPYQVGEHALHMTSSIGIATFPANGADALTLLRNADNAMYHAKAEGRDMYAFFSLSMTSRARAVLQVRHELRRAVERGQFVLHYQPQVDLRSGRIVGAEALVRWQHPERGLIYPGSFIGIAEDCGLIEPLGAWVMHEACRQNKAWQDAGLPPLIMAVNLSARQFQRNQVEQLTGEAIAASGLAPEWLELEITEGMVMQNVELAIEVMQRLVATGVRLSIDDFGTGYSSLSYLKRFPIDKLKIDQSFVRDLGQSGNNPAIVTAIIALAKSMELKVIADGVEDQSQMAYLRRQGCDEIQGYYLSKPVGAERFAPLLAADGHYGAQVAA